MMAGLTMFAGHLNNLYMQKPWYYGKYQLLIHLILFHYFLALYPRLAGIGVLAGIGYWLGVMREHHNRTRDAVVDHYASLHPQDFERVSDSKLSWKFVLTVICF
jgi:hypothetical protein